MTEKQCSQSLGTSRDVKCDMLTEKVTVADKWEYWHALFLVSDWCSGISWNSLKRPTGVSFHLSSQSTCPLLYACGNLPLWTLPMDFLALQFPIGFGQWWDSARNQKHSHELAKSLNQSSQFLVGSSPSTQSPLSLGSNKWFSAPLTLRPRDGKEHPLVVLCLHTNSCGSSTPYTFVCLPLFYLSRPSISFWDPDNSRRYKFINFMGHKLTILVDNFSFWNFLPVYN